MDLEESMIELQTKSVYQEDLLQTLNEVVAAQQKQIDALQAELLGIRDYLKSAHGSQLARPEEEVPPPHY